MICFCIFCVPFSKFNKLFCKNTNGLYDFKMQGLKYFTNRLISNMRTSNGMVNNKSPKTIDIVFILACQDMSIFAKSIFLKTFWN